MTIEFWPRALLRPRAKRIRPKKKPKSRRPKLPIAAGKARLMLCSAILAEDHDLASWIDEAVKTRRVLPKPQPDDLRALKQRLDAVMRPLPS